ncbi:MAG: tRNA (adenine-N1)-methyltransferase [Thermoplasmata archaeon]|nr:tRNA (adenine-N1)-methyltransferase [Thermoplasmata archaeon]
MVKKGEMAALTDGKEVFSLLISGEVVKAKPFGIVDTSRLLDMVWGEEVEINERTYTLLHPSLADRLCAVRRKAQIVTLKDAAVIVARTGIGGGDLVVEAGAGSGALSIALCHAIAPSGQLVTYEIREDFAAIARDNIAAAGYSHISVIKMGDVSKSIEEREASAVVLDLPEPWGVLDNAMLALRPGGVLAAYVPTVNQVERTVRAAREKGMFQVLCTETMERELEIGPGGARPSYSSIGHTGYVITARRP